jgi:hypothetical protein
MPFIPIAMTCQRVERYRQRVIMRITVDSRGYHRERDAAHMMLVGYRQRGIIL